MKLDEERLVAWFAARLPEARDVRLAGLDRVTVGHSAETVVMTVRWRDGSGPRERPVVIRVRPPAPGLLEPYDLKRQFDILRGLDRTAVRAPRALWFEPSGQPLGQEFYVMEKLPGTVYERGFPPGLASDRDRIRRMSESVLEQIAAIHRVDLRATGLDALGDGRGYLDRQLDHWSDQIRRFQQDPLPALELLITGLRECRPEQCPTMTLVHGDPKPGNFAFTGTEVTAVFDWEMADIGDPLADIGWVEILWNSPGYPTSAPGALTVNEFVARWEQLTGIPTQDREWYRAFQSLKMAAILYVGGRLFDAGYSDDLRLMEMTAAIAPVTRRALQELGLDEDLDPGPVRPREDRVHQVQEALSQ
ncbi:MAG TPA: phosphotransferase family protein [Acidimicrobiales bacterium]|nr:phosphotransferase family protein [Acidimicrobiales bacterium]